MDPAPPLSHADERSPGPLPRSTVCTTRSALTIDSFCPKGGIQIGSDNITGKAHMREADCPWLRVPESMERGRIGTGIYEAGHRAATAKKQSSQSASPADAGFIARFQRAR